LVADAPLAGTYMKTVGYSPDGATFRPENSTVNGFVVVFNAGHSHLEPVGQFNRLRLKGLPAFAVVWLTAALILP
jgi:hypothetical protein